MMNDVPARLTEPGSAATMPPDTLPFPAALSAAAQAGVPLRAVGAASALPARVAADSGFDALWVSGLEVSAALGLPDENVLTSQDLADVIQSLRRVTGLPVIVDMDNAGGSVPTARRFGGDLARAGASALCLEDSAYPKVNSFAVHRDQHLADPGLMAGQLAALRDVCGPGMVLVARTETLITGGTVGEALRRGSAYAAAGADLVLVHSRDTSGSQALEVAGSWPGPALLATIPTAFPHIPLEKLGEAGFALAIYANQLSRAALAAMRATAGAIAATGGVPADLDLAAVQDLLQIAQPAARACL